MDNIIWKEAEHIMMDSGLSGVKLLTDIHIGTGLTKSKSKNGCR